MFKKYCFLFLFFLNFISINAWQIVGSGETNFHELRAGNWQLILDKGDSFLEGQIDCFVHFMVEHKLRDSCGYFLTYDGAKDMLMHCTLSVNLSESSAFLPGDFYHHLQNMWFLKCLNLSNCGLTFFPDELSNLEELEFLELGDNKIPALSENMGKLKKLKALFLCHNSLKDIPHSIGSLENLETLHLSHNLLDNLPEAMGFLKKLWYLNLMHNRLTAVPITFGQMERLQRLLLNNNFLEDLPEELQDLAIPLETLELSDNCFEHFPRVILDLDRLKTLGLSGHSLKMLPRSLERLKKLENLCLCRNKVPLKVPVTFRNLSPQYGGKLTFLNLEGTELASVRHHYDLESLREIWGDDLRHEAYDD